MGSRRWADFSWPSSPVGQSLLHSDSERSLSVACLRVFEIIMVQDSSSGQGRKSDIVYQELLCVRKEILNTALKSLGYTSTELN